MNQNYLQSSRASLGLAALLVLSGCASPSGEDSKKPLPAAVARIKGQARYMPSGENIWQALKPKDKVHSGDVIQTAMEKGTFVDIAAPPLLVSLDPYFSNAYVPDTAPIPPNGWDRRLWSTPAPVVNSYVQAQEQQKKRRLLLRLWENSTLKFEELAEAKSANASERTCTIRLDLKAGSAAFQEFGAPGTVDCQVRFTNCLAKIRAGTFDIRGGTLRVVRGTASITQGNGQTIEVPDGFSFKVETGAVEPLPANVLRMLTIISD